MRTAISELVDSISTEKNDEKSPWFGFESRHYTDLSKFNEFLGIARIACNQEPKEVGVYLGDDPIKCIYKVDDKIGSFSLRAAARDSARIDEFLDRKIDKLKKRIELMERRGMDTEELTELYNACLEVSERAISDEDPNTVFTHIASFPTQACSLWNEYVDRYNQSKDRENELKKPGKEVNPVGVLNATDSKKEGPLI